MNICTFTGRLVKEIELKQTTGGKTYADFTIAVPRRDKDKNTDFIYCRAWNSQAEAISNYLRKGSLFELTGRLEVQQHERDGQKQTRYMIVVSTIGFLESGKQAEEKKPEPVQTPPPVTDQGYFQPSLDETDEAMLPFDV